MLISELPRQGKGQLVRFILGSVLFLACVGLVQAQNGETEWIVGFDDAQSFDAELSSVRSAHPLLANPRNASDQAMVAAEEARLRAELAKARNLEAKGRVDKLGKRLGVNLKHQRVLATGASLVKMPNGKGARNLAKRLAKQAGVAYVEENARMYPLLTPNDTYYTSQWHYYESTAGLNLPSAWDVTNGSGTVVAVLDTGITDHSDLDGNVIAGYDFVSSAANARDGNGRDSNPDDEGDWAGAGECYSGSPASNSSWHGTHVAGTVAAVSNNSKGVAGVAYGAKIMPVRVLAKCGGTLADIADAIIWSSGGSVSGVSNTSTPADVINMSLGGSGSCGSTYQNAINTAVGNGSTVVVAAGNSNTNASNARPANCSNVVTVAASDRQGNRASYSNYGSVVDVTAPGGETATSSNGVASTLNSGSTTPGSESYAYYQGTSMAAPHVAGVAALMLSVDSTLSPAQVESTLKSTVRPLAGSCSGGCGAGLVDASAAVAAVDGGGTPPGDGTTELNNGDSVSGLSGASGSWQYFKIAVPSGATDLSVQISGGSGDADLYLRQGAKPTTSSYDCRPYRNGNNETCSVASPTTGDYYIGIRGYTSYSSVTLSVSYTEPGSGTGGGGTVENLSGSSGSWKHYTLSVPAGQSLLEVDISGGSGDADLYVRYGARPTTSSYDCRPYRNGNNESCDFSNPAAGTWHISIRGYTSYSGVTLDAYYSP